VCLFVKKVNSYSPSVDNGFLSFSLSLSILLKTFCLCFVSFTVNHTVLVVFVFWFLFFFEDGKKHPILQTGKNILHLPDVHWTFDNTKVQRGWK